LWEYFSPILKKDIKIEIKIIDLFVMLKKVKKSFMECEKDIDSIKNGHF